MAMNLKSVTLKYITSVYQIVYKDLINLNETKGLYHSFFPIGGP